MSVSALGLLAKCCESCGTSFRECKEDIDTRARTHAYTPSNLLRKHYHNTVQSVCLVWGPGARLLTFHPRPGQRWHGDYRRIPINTHKARYSTSRKALVKKSFTSLTFHPNLSARCTFGDTAGDQLMENICCRPFALSCSDGRLRLERCSDPSFSCPILISIKSACNFKSHRNEISHPASATHHFLSLQAGRLTFNAWRQILV